MKISQDKFESRLNDLEKQCRSVCVSKPAAAPAPAKSAPAKPAAKDNDDDVDLFGSGSEVNNYFVVFIIQFYVNPVL